MIKFGFRIRTRNGLAVDNLVIQGRDRAEAERKLKQMYHHCEILECSVIEETLAGNGTDLDGFISLIAKQERGQPD